MNTYRPTIPYREKKWGHKEIAETTIEKIQQ
jgi:hypothetical protein